MSTNTTPEEKPALEDITKRIYEVLLDVPHEPLSCLVDTAEALSAMLGFWSGTEDACLLQFGYLG